MESDWRNKPFFQTKDNATEKVSTWSIAGGDGESLTVYEAQTLTKTDDGTQLVNGEPKGDEKGEAQLHPIGHISKLPDGKEKTGPLGPVTFFSTLQKSEVILWGSQKIDGDDATTTVYFQKPTPGSHVLRPGQHPKFQGIRGGDIIDKLNFLSLMACPVLWNRVAAAHPHPLLHGKGRDQCPTQHDRRHRRHWLLLRADALHGSGGDDQRGARRDQQ